MEHVYATRAANCCSWFQRDLPPLCCIFFHTLILRDFSFCCVFLSFFLLGPFENSRVSWVDFDPVLLVLYSLAHPVQGWSMVDESRKETADNKQGWKVPDRLGGGTLLSVYPNRTTNCCGCLQGAFFMFLFLLCSGLTIISLGWFLVILCFYVCSGVCL